MIRFRLPAGYDRRAGVLGSIAEVVAPLGSRALLIGGETALHLVQPAIGAALAGQGIALASRVARGRPTAALVSQAAAAIAVGGFDVVIAAGGGRALDLAKAAAAEAGRPIVTVPTVPATCAAWAALSILYDEAGAQVEIRHLPRAPVHVLADTAILAAAPARFLAAGIADTVVKWWETAPNLRGPGDPLALRLQAHLGRFTLDTIEAAFARHADLTQLAGDPEAWGDVVDAVVMLAGLVGSPRTGAAWGGFAHPFYVAATRAPETHAVLHGAIVGFGLLVQWGLEGRAEAEIAAQAGWLRRLGLPVTLAELGLTGDPATEAGRLAGPAAEAAARSVFGGASEAAILGAILAVDAIGRGLAARPAAPAR